MKKSKRLLAILLSVMVLITYMPATVSAAGDDIASGTSGTCEWVIDADGKMTISEGELGNWYPDYPPWYKYADKITEVKMDGVVKPATCYLMFAECESLSSLDLSTLDTANVKDMAGMFHDCRSLKDIDLSSLDTSNVIRISSMFAYCSNIESIIFGSFDTSKVSDMTEMFINCESLKALDLNGFDTSKVERMQGMFRDCRELISLDLNAFNTSNVTNMSLMFSGCWSLENLGLGSFDTSKVTDMRDMFEECERLSTLDLRNFSTENVKDMQSMFRGCSYLESLNTGSFDTSQVTNMSYMFAYCSSLLSLDLSNFDTSSVTDMQYMFASCYSLEKLNVSSFDTSSVTDMQYMFFNLSCLERLDLSSFNTSNANNMTSMFSWPYNRPAIRRLDVGTWVYSEDVKNNDRYPTFPREMKNSSTGTVYKENSVIPERSNYIYILPDESLDDDIVQYRHEPPKTITENDLYGPYYKYLFSSSYESITNTLVGDMNEVNSDRTLWDNVSSILISNMKNGGGKSLLNAIYCSLSDKYYNQNDIEEKLALDYIYAMSQDSHVVNDCMDIFDKTYKIEENVYTIIKAGAKNRIEKNELAKAIEKSTKGKFDKSEALKTIRSAEDNYEKISKAFEKVGIAVNATEIAVTVIMASVTNKEITKHLIDITEPGTPLYRGLISVQRKQKYVAESYIKALFNDEVAGKIASEMTKHGVGRLANLMAGNGLIKPGLSTAVASIGYYVVGSFFDSFMANSDEIVESITAVSNMRSLNTSVANIRTKMAEAGSGERFKEEYMFAYSAYLAAIDNSVETVLKVGLDGDAKSKLEAHYAKYRNQLTYNQYIDACIANANQKLNYTVNGGKATITGYNKPKAVLLAASAGKANSANMTANADKNECVYIDIPEEVDGYPVVGIDEESFIDDKTIGGVYIPNSIESIGIRAFSGCTNIQDVFIGEQVKTISDYAFEDCTSLDTITLPESLESLGESVFSGIKSILVAAKDTQVIDEYCLESSDNVIVTKTGRELSEIYISSPADKLSYTMSEISEPDEQAFASGKKSAVDISGLTLRAVYDDGSEEIVTKDFYGAIEEKQLGINTVTVYYLNKTVSYTVNVTADECKYDISYVDECGNELAEKSTGTAMAGSKITVNVPEIDGYKAVSKAAEENILADNHFVVEYESIRKPSIADAEIKLSEAPFTYTGFEINPDVTVKFEGKTLERDKDYTLTYENNIEIGEAAVEIEGIGDYEGIVIETYMINSTDQDDPTNEENSCVNGHSYDAWKITKAATEISLGQKARTCTVCHAVEKVSIPMLNPTLKAVKILKPKAGKKSATIKWKKIVKKYLKKIKQVEIQFSTDKSFKKGVKTKYAKATKTSYKLKGLKKGKKYYVRIRAYTKSGGKVHVSKWSAPKSFKAK